MNERARIVAILFQGGLPGRDGPPLWRVWPWFETGTSAVLSLRESLVRDLAIYDQFIKSNSTALSLILILFFVVLFVVLPLNRRIKTWDEPDQNVLAASKIFKHPVSVALLIGLLNMMWLSNLMPPAIKTLIGFLLLIPILRIIPPIIRPALRPLVYALVISFLIDGIRGLLIIAPSLERWIFAAQIAGAIFLVVWGMKSAGDQKPANWGMGSDTIRTGLRLLLGLFIVSLAANILGFVALSKVLGEGTLTSLYLATILYGGVRVAMVVVAVVLRTTRAGNLSSMRTRSDVIYKWVNRAFGLLAFIFWLTRTLDYFTIADQVFAAVRYILTASLTIGEIQISLGVILAFALTAAIALAIARVIRFVLREDVLPRMSLQHGIPYAISATVYYFVLLLGFMLALGAAGIDLSKIALLTGALGVGIGFGLQNIVNNFVSGLILLFERPVRLGDNIEVGGEFGTVTQIGMRSSVVRTPQGADLIVPNADLISNRFLNWTLSDRLRRFELPVSVATDANPQQVRELLLAVAKSDPDVLQSPAPVVEFIKLGDITIDFVLRYWLVQNDDTLNLKNRISNAVFNELKKAGLETPSSHYKLIPFAPPGDANRK